MNSVEAVAEIVKKAKDMMSIDRKALEKIAGSKSRVDFSTSPAAMWTINVKGDKIVIINKKYVSVGGGDIIVGDLVVGKM